MTKSTINRFVKNSKISDFSSETATIPFFSFNNNSFISSIQIIENSLTIFDSSISSFSSIFSIFVSLSTNFFFRSSFYISFIIFSNSNVIDITFRLLFIVYFKIRSAQNVNVIDSLFSSLFILHFNVSFV